MSWLTGYIRRIGALVRTIRVRLTLWYVALLALILVGLSIFLYLNLARNLQTELDRSLQNEIAHVMATLDVQDGHPALSEELSPLDTGFVVTLFDATGTRQLGANSRTSLPLSALAADRARQGLSTLDRFQSNGTTWRVLAAPVVENGQVTAVLQVARSQSDVSAALSQLVSVLAIGIPLTLLLAVSGGLFLAGRALGPIDRMTRAAERLGADDLSGRLGVQETDDEVGRLASTFDRLLDRLERAFERQRQFTADASHELRTPLALLLSQTELALERPRPAGEYRRVLASLRDDARRVNQLVGDLLTLARADAGEELLTREVFDLSDIAAGVVTALQPLANAAGVELVRAETDPAIVEGDQTQLTQLLVNLTENALAHTPSGGVVTISTSRPSQWALLSVADNGVGIAPEHLPHLFERFYRADPARSRERGGAGLGLAICQWIARAHGGDVAVTSALGHGTTFTVTLPTVGPPRPPKL